VDSRSRVCVTERHRASQQRIPNLQPPTECRFPHMRGQSLRRQSSYGLSLRPRVSKSSSEKLRGSAQPARFSNRCNAERFRTLFTLTLSGVDDGA
jgi:hypothetical protein